MITSSSRATIVCEILEIKASNSPGSTYPFSIQCLQSITLLHDDCNYMGHRDEDFTFVGHRALLRIRRYTMADKYTTRIVIWDFKNSTYSTDLVLADAKRVRWLTFVRPRVACIKGC